jgi:hypothetical protein
MTVWRIRQVGPLDAAAVLASDVFDGPACPRRWRRSLVPTALAIRATS